MGSSGRLGLAGRDVIDSDPGRLRPGSVGVGREGVVIVRAFCGWPAAPEFPVMIGG